VARCADEAERARALPDELRARLAACGCMRLAVPARYGGEELPLPQVLAVVEALARADGSTGWAVAQVALAQTMLAYLPAAALDELYAHGPDLPAAGAAAPKGRAVREPDGWRVSGEWPLVSGCRHAAWLFVQCLVVEEGAIRLGPDGVPRMRMAVLPAAHATVRDTWDAVGLCATGSHHVRVERVLCPHDRTCELASASPGSGATCRIPPPVQGGLLAAASATGIAQGALDALAALAAGGKRPAFATRRLADAPLLRDRLGDAEMTLAAARALLHGEVAQADVRVAGGVAVAPLARARLRAVAVKAVELATHVTDTASALAGSSAVLAGSPLGRRLRDALTARQHFAVGRELYAPYGALLAGEPVPPALA
jgi:alkylation response protein AidB-like acyl-CoA dehydrogenase